MIRPRVIKTAGLYALLVGAPGLLLLWVVQQTPAAGANTTEAVLGPTAAPVPLPNLLVLIIQLIVILTAARLLGWLFRRIGQPQVVGEMAAGLLLGPSVFGALSPQAFQTIFPPQSLGYLSTLSQLGLLLFMFMVGLEFDPRLMRGRGQAALITSHASMVLPFLLGATLAIWLFPQFAPAGVRFHGFALFMGAAMSVTAFPVLARILMENNLTHTRVGVLALACAAVDDVTAWCMLAVVIVVVRAGSGTPVWVTLGGTAAFVAVMLVLARPLLRRGFGLLRHPERPTQDVVAALLLFALISALITERIGIHALFGAFLAGAVIPREEAFVPELIRKLEDLTVVFLLPLFFALTGLRTSFSFGLSETWIALAFVTTVAIAGKLFGSALAARLSGMSGREALAIGVLLNTRGLMELVILNIGLDVGVLSPSLFSIMVTMALITTVMTAPFLHLLHLPTAPAPVRSAKPMDVSGIR
jgi:Kef-type K+ transport system membrane component KefB